jgi:hypothetical protein
MVKKILYKDKNYNLLVSRVAERQAQIDILNKDIFTLEKEYQILKNEGKIKIQINKISFR